MRLSKIFLLLLSLHCLAAGGQAQPKGHYDSALQYLKYRLPEGLKTTDKEEVIGFQIMPSFAQAELVWFEKELDSLYTQREFRKMQKMSLATDFPEEVCLLSDASSTLRLQFSPLRGNLLIVKLEKLRGHASNPKISIDKQTLELWYLLFCFDKEGKIVHTFAKRFQTDPLRND